MYKFSETNLNQYLQKKHNVMKQFLRYLSLNKSCTSLLSFSSSDCLEFTCVPKIKRILSKRLETCNQLNEKGQLFIFVIHPFIAHHVITVVVSE